MSLQIMRVKRTRRWGLNMKAKRAQLLLWCMVAVGLAIAIFLTPLVLEQVAPTQKDWGRLSSVSQTYGALSAPFSAIALLGVAASLAYQARQTKIANQEAQRSSHRQLLMYAVDRPEFLVCWEPVSGISSPVEMQRLFFTNMIVSNWSADYLLRRWNDQEARVQLGIHFQGTVARTHWEKAGSSWRQVAEASGDTRRIRFVDLVDESYAGAMAAGPGVPPEGYFASPLIGPAR
ncbi:DUF6082 family protein [Streptomyces sp. NPDC046805]|uniref:DUF6082 family protein n=1 Tax=Streptomyces sp. NPDC046805 TaxID=3155134 RepID=UPI0033CFE471